MMAFQILNVAWLVRTSPIAKAVLVSLADRADWPKGFCHSSHRDMANRTSLSEKSVSRGIDELERAGHITVDRSNGRHSKYLVHPKPPTDSLGSIDKTTDSQSGVASITTDSQSVVAITQTAPTTDSQSGDPGLTVHKPRTDSPTNRQEPSGTVKVKRAPRAGISLRTYLDQCQAEGRDPIASTASVFSLAEAKGIPNDLIVLAWSEFKRHHLPNGKSERTKQADWPKTFRNAVDANWYRLWWTTGDGVVEATSSGREAKNLHDRLARQHERIAA